MWAPRAGAWGWMIGAVLAVAAVRADEAAPTDPPPAPPADAVLDDSLLEFLGSVDSGDPEWNDYLAHAELPAAGMSATAAAAAKSQGAQEK